MRSGMANVWIRSSDGELFRADALVHLRCHDGVVEATFKNGRCVPLTGSGCPADFHLQLLLELARVNLDDRWIVIISPEDRPEGTHWIQATADDLVGAREVGVGAPRKRGAAV
jgi:hypothetical protein